MMEKRLRQMIKEHGPTKWHDCVSSLINACVDETNSSRQDVLDAAASMPYLIDVRGSLEEVTNDDSCGQAIISDGNDVFIDAFIKRNDLENCFTHGIETNIGNWDDCAPNNTTTNEQFSVVHQSTKYGGHSCKKCPPNLCKSQVLTNILRRIDAKRPRLVYIGDGSNDVCPALNVLDVGDVLLAREGKRIGNPNSKSGEQPDVKSIDELTGTQFPILSTIEKRQREDGLVPSCRVCTWNSGRELRNLVQDILDETK